MRTIHFVDYWGEPDVAKLSGPIELYIDPDLSTHVDVVVAPFDSLVALASAPLHFNTHDGAGNHVSWMVCWNMYFEQSGDHEEEFAFRKDALARCRDLQSYASLMDSSMSSIELVGFDINGSDSPCEL